jgi:hypothetical protein
LDAQTAQYVHEQLTSVIAGHAQATTTYSFYEELDSWLGPWGQRGYPIGYGKFYNIAFTTNAKLMANPTTQQWVWRTTILLQEALRDYIVDRVRNGSLPSLTEPQLRKAAFDSHPRAYDHGGLAMVILVAPELLLVIATIPSAEFSPTSKNLNSSINQIFATLGETIPTVVGSSLAALAGPAHTGVLSRSVRQDYQRRLNELAIGHELGNLRIMINWGELDHIPWLDQIIARLNARQFSNQATARFAGEVVQAANMRRLKVIQNYDQLLRQSPEMRTRIDRVFPGTLP